ncbi:acyltransferase family protein [Paenibacillus terreus]|uniref:Acyltransferase family protein n=1 Tax=Paenibacillus terreus TaxID=1387834 RepID=A0ABV5B9B3_9BACL
MSKPLKPHRYMPGLDGLRAFAVLAVVIYHLNTDWAPGGLLGVGIFFVLSGYLITDILAGQWERNRRFEMADFWVRRARRLLPAMFVMVAVVSLWCLIGDHSRLSALGGDIPAALLYVSNWWFIFHKVSYFESFGPASPLGHLWSLAVEEQFYLIWPFLLLLGLKFLSKRGQLSVWILSLSLISALLMALLYIPGEDPSRVYYGTDTRIFALLVGAALAVVWPSTKLKTQVSRPALTFLDTAGALSLLLLIWLVWHTNEYQTFLYRGGMLIIAIITALLIAVLAHPASRLAAVIGCKPLRWLGKRSYGLYLWHYPVITLSTPQVNTDDPSILKAVIQVAVSLALAELSWRFVEQPIRQKGFRHVLQHTLKKRATRIWLYGGVAALVFILFSATLGHALTVRGQDRGVQTDSSALSVISTPPTNVSHVTTAQNKDHDTETAGKQDTSDGEQDHTDKKDTGGDNVKEQGHAGKTASGHSTQEKTEALDSDSTDSQAASSSGGAGKQDSASAAHPGSTAADSGSADNRKKLSKIISGKGFTAIGDSVMLDIEPYLRQTMPGILIDGKVGRQMNEASAVIQQLSSNGQLGSKVIIELGTNGSFTKEQLDDLLSQLSSAKKIILVNTRVPRPWESIVNDALNAASAEDPRVTVVDWYSASKGQDAFFAGDGVHLNPSGAKVYATLVANTIAGK